MFKLPNVHTPARRAAGSRSAAGRSGEADGVKHVACPADGAWACAFAFVLLCSAVAGVQLAPEGARTTGDRVDEILTRLQERSDGLKDIRCKVRYVEDDRINLSKQTKLGTILFLITEPNPHFLIHFERTEAEGVAGKQEWYLFDGLWLYETLERIKQVTKRQIARPGEKVDLFDLERAPFPLPFGQKKETILRNFDVTLAPPAERDPPDTDHLVCIPKAESRLHRKYDKLDFFVRKDIHLPGRVVVTRSEGLEISTADFPDLSGQSINAGVTKKDFLLPDAWKKYEVVVEELAPEEKPAPWGESRGD